MENSQLFLKKVAKPVLEKPAVEKPVDPVEPELEARYPRVGVQVKDQLENESHNRRWNDVVVPHDFSAERCFLGSFILTRSRRRARAMVLSIKPAGRDAFFDPWNQCIYGGIEATWRKYGHCDAVLLMDWTRTPEANVDGISFTESGTALKDIVQILNSVPCAAHGPHYGSILRNLWICRQAIAMSQRLSALAMSRATVDKLRECTQEFNQHLNILSVGDIVNKL